MSWEVMYHPHWSKLPRPSTPEEYAKCREVVVRLTLDFSGMINSLEEDRQKHSSDIHDILASRSVNFLLIMLVNIGMMIPQSRSINLFQGAQKVRTTFPLLLCNGSKSRANRYLDMTFSNQLLSTMSNATPN